MGKIELTQNEIEAKEVQLEDLEVKKEVTELQIDFTEKQIASEIPIKQLKAQKRQMEQEIRNVVKNMKILKEQIKKGRA